MHDRIVFVGLAMLLGGCASAGAASPVEGNTKPAGWLADTPNATASFDLAGLRADPAYGTVLACPLAPPGGGADAGVRDTLAALPCHDALLQAARADVWIRREESGEQSELVVFRGASAGAACLATEERGTALTSTTTETVRRGQRWPRVYVIQGPGRADVVFPTGKAIPRARAAFLREIAPPAAEPLEAGALARVRGDDALLGVLRADLPRSSTLNLTGLVQGELLVRPTTATPGDASFTVRARFQLQDQADNLGPALAHVADDLWKSGHPMELGRVDSWTYLAKARYPVAALGARRCAPGAP